MNFNIIKNPKSVYKNKFSKPQNNKKTLTILKDKYGLSLVGIYSIAIACLLSLFILIYFLNKKQESSSQINELETQIMAANDSIEAAKKIQKNSADLTGKEKLDIINSLKIDLEKSVGAKVTSVSVDEKIPIPASPKIYYKVKIGYAVKDLDSLKTILAVLYIHPKIVKITDVDNSSINAIVTNLDSEE